MQREMVPEVDMMDVGARQENLAVKGEPIMLQLCVVPAYALTVASESYVMGGIGGTRGSGKSMLPSGRCTRRKPCRSSTRRGA